MNTTRLFHAVALTLLTVLAAPSAQAQSIWLPPANRSQLSLEADKAMYAESEDIGFMTTAWFLTGWAQVSPTLALQAELPYARYEQESYDAESLVGNPYVGIVYGSVDRQGVVVEAGARLPLVSEDDAFENLGAAFNGIATDVTRMEAFLPKLVTVRLRAGGYAISNTHTGLYLRMMAGGQFWIPTDDGDTETLADVDLGLWHLNDKSSFGAVFSAKSILSEPDLSFTERSEFTLGLSGSMRFGRAEPGVDVRLPIGNEGFLGVGEFVDAVLGAHVVVHLGD